MSHEIDIDSTLRDFYDCVNREDIAAATRHFDAGAVRVEPEGFPSSGTYRGIAAVRAQLARGRGTWAEGRCEPEQIFVKADHAVVFVRVAVRLKGASEWMHGRFADGFVFQGARITLHCSFAERADALAWAGIAPAG